MSKHDRTLLCGARVYSTSDPYATALLMEGDTVTWIGPVDSAATLFRGASDLTVVELAGHLITPSFVDAAPVRAVPDYSRGITDVLTGDTHAPVITPDSSPINVLELAQSGLPYALGSGERTSSPWEWVYAVAYAPPAHARISDRAAFLAATRAGRRLLGIDHPGSLNPGAPASLAVWEPCPLVVHGNDERIQTWSTDPRSRTPLLPDLSDRAFPAAHIVARDGEIVYSRNQSHAG